MGNVSRRRRLLVGLAGVLLFATVSDVTAATTATDPLFQVSNVKAGGVSPGTIFVAWTDDSLFEQAFEVQQSLDPNAADEQWTIVGTAPARNNNPPTGQRPGISVPITTNSLQPVPQTVYYFRSRARVLYHPMLPDQGINGPWGNVDPSILGPWNPSVNEPVASGTGVTVSWVNDPRNASDSWFVANEVFRAAPGQGLGSAETLIATLPGTATSFVDNFPSALGGSLLRYRIVAVRQTVFAFGTNTTYLEEGRTVGTPDGLSVTAGSTGGGGTTPPAAPSGLTAALISNGTQAKLDWVDNATDEDGFYVEYSNDGVNWLTQTVPTPNTITYTQAIPADATRYYQVRAYRNSDTSTTALVSAPSNVVSLTSPPRAPSNLKKISATAMEVEMAWNDNSVTEDGFEIESCFGTCAASSSGWASLDTVGADATMYTAVTVGNQTKSYRVRAFNSGGSSAYSNILTVTTPPPTLTPPANLDAQQIPNDSRHLKLVWSDTTIGEDGFRIEYAPTTSGPWGILDEVGAGVTMYIDGSALDPGEQRCYRIRAFAGSTGASNPSNVDCAQTAPPQLPGTPSNLTANALDSTRIKLDWMNHPGAGIQEGTEVWRSTDGTNFILVRTITNGAATTYTDPNLWPRTAYTYKVRAFNIDGVSGFSNIVTETTLGPPPPVWINPSMDDQVQAYSCMIDGTSAANEGVDAVVVYISNTVNGQTVFVGTAAKAGSGLTSTPGSSFDFAGHWTIPVHIDPGRYHLAAYAHQKINGQDVFSAPAHVHGWTVPADSPCPPL